MKPSNIFALAAGADNSACYAATDAGLWQWTVKRGAWKQLAPQFAPVALTAVAAHDQTVLIGANGDIAVSRDNAATFGLATLPIKAQVLALALSPNFAKDNIALAATAQDGVLRSTDGGVTFHAWNFGLLDLHINALVMSPDFANDATVFAATDNAVFISTNSGRAWRELPLPAEAAPVIALALRDNGALLVGTEGAGLWTAAAPYASFEQDKKLKADDVNALTASIAATPEGVFAHTGRTWKRISEEVEVIALASAAGRCFAGTAGGNAFVIDAD